MYVSVRKLPLPQATNLRKLRFQIVEEQRVDDFMNVLDAGVVHPAAAPGLRVQSGFKHRAENRRADGRPVKVRTGFFQQQVNDLIAQTGNLNVLVRKQPAVDIGERGKVFIKVFVPFLRTLVEYAK